MLGGHHDSELHTLEDAVAALVNDSCLGLDAEALTERSCRIQRITNQIDALRTTTLRHTERALVAEQPGTRCATVVAGNTKVDTAGVREDQRLGQWLDEFTSFADAHLSGTMSRGHIKLLRKVDNLRNHYQLQQDQELFIRHAETLDFKDFEQVVAVRFAL